MSVLLTCCFVALAAFRPNATKLTHDGHGEHGEDTEAQLFSGLSVGRKHSCYSGADGTSVDAEETRVLST
jgi:hypothetical protein